MCELTCSVERDVSDNSGSCVDDWDCNVWNPNLDMLDRHRESHIPAQFVVLLALSQCSLCLYLCILSSSICSYQCDIDDWTCGCFGSRRI